MKGLRLIVATLCVAMLGLLALPNEASARFGLFGNRSSSTIVQKQVIRQPVVRQQVVRQRVVQQVVAQPAYAQQVVQQVVAQPVYAQQVQQVVAQPVVVQRYVAPAQQVILQQSAGCVGNGGLQLNAGCQALYR